MSADVAQRVAAAKLWLVSASAGNLPYLSTAVYSLVTVPTDRVAAMSTDVYWRLYVNPLWALATDVDVLARELAHQVWHLLADHAGRAMDARVDAKSRDRWKLAADLTVAEVLPFDAGLPHPRDVHQDPNRSAEEYFRLLRARPVTRPALEVEPDHTCGSGCDGMAREHDLPPGDAELPGLSTQAAEAIRQTVAIEFREHCTTYGSIPGEWGRWVSQILDPVVPWQQVLHAAVRRGIGWGQGQVDYTYSKISRRQQSVGAAIVPALRRPVPAVAVVIDTSGSIDDGLLSQALGEVKAVLASLAVADSSVTVLAVDAAVHTVAQVRDVNHVRLAGGGGTDMGAGISGALACRPAPQTVIVLTDGYTPWPAVPAPVPVIVGVLGRQRDQLPPTPDWVQRVEVVPDG
ncbi:MAG TPA: VWA-like domain-containing protein [Actinomycetota bacterium]|nr:VWA-like domain-containing protein [Actinomycetota bacterium]